MERKFNHATLIFTSFHFCFFSSISFGIVLLKKIANYIFVRGFCPFASTYDVVLTPSVLLLLCDSLVKKTLHPPIQGVLNSELA